MWKNKKYDVKWLATSQLDAVPLVIFCYYIYKHMLEQLLDDFSTQAPEAKSTHFIQQKMNKSTNNVLGKSFMLI